MDIEIWKPVKGFEGFYEVSNQGRVRSLPRKVLCKGDSTREDFFRTWPGKIMSFSKSHNGYSVVHLRKTGVSKSVKVNRMVAKAFLRNEENFPEVNHINSVKSDNTLKNLEWCSRSWNCQHSYNIGRNFGEKTGKPRGVYFYKRTQSWMARIYHNTEFVFLGYHESESNAYKAYFEKFKELRGHEPWDLSEYPTHEGVGRVGNRA